MATLPPCLEAQKAANPHLSEVYGKIQTAASRSAPRCCPRRPPRRPPAPRVPPASPARPRPRRPRTHSASVNGTLRLARAPPCVLLTCPVCVRCGALRGSSKLWHQATLALEELVKDPCFSADGNRDLLTLYDDLVKDQPSGSQWSGFGGRMNAVRHAALAIRVSKQHGDSESGIAQAISFLEAVGEKLTSDKEALLLLRLEVARRTLQAGKVDAAKEKLEACKSVLVDFAELDSSVNSAYYRVSALLQKTLGEAGEFYTCSLLYLAYTSLDTLTAEEKQALAFDLGLAALCAEKLYQFGELLLHPILKSLEGTPGEWLVTMLSAFNKGDIAAFEKVSKDSEVAINQQPALVGNAQRLRGRPFDTSPARAMRHMYKARKCSACAC
jgi:hypothetical protein